MSGGMIDWDDAFDNMGHVPGSAALPERWREAAGRFAARMQAAGRLMAGLAYGPGARERLDLFTPEGESAGLVVFVHGGYWMKFDKSVWSHLAAGAVARGWTVAVPSYPLAPEARISEISRSVARAVSEAAARVPGEIRLAGHSAGGHLVARMLCAGALPAEVAARLARVVSISGLYQLGPLTLTRMNEQLRLSAQEAESESPCTHRPLPSVPFTAWVGTRERPEFLRQARLIEEVWQQAGGADVRAVYEPGHDHFTVIEALTHPDSALVREILR